MTFRAKRADGKSRWLVIYELAVAAKPGDTVTYDAIAKALDTTDRKIIYRAAAKANEKLWERASRSLEVEADVGYRVLLPTEHERQALRVQQQSRTKLGHAVAIASATDLMALETDEERRQMLTFQQGMLLLANAFDRIAAKVQQHDDLYRELKDDMEKRDAANAEALKAIDARLARMEELRNRRKKG